MSSKKRRAAATATIGLAGVGGAGMMRHHALEEAYLEKTPNPIKRPRFAAELRMLKHPKGRAAWLTGAGLGAVSIPPAAVGTHGLMTKRHSIFQEGYEGVRESIQQRNENLASKPPAKLVAGNYLAGAGVGSGAGALVHHTLDKTKLSGAKRSGLASIAGVVAGSATLPLQSKIIARASHGRYEATPTGVRRKKRKPVRPSAKAGIQPEAVTKIAVRTHGEMVREGYGRKLPRRKPRLIDRTGAKWTGTLNVMADSVDRNPIHRRAAAGAFRELANDTAYLPRAAEPLLRHVSKSIKVRVIHDPPLPKIVPLDRNSQHWHPLSRAAAARKDAAHFAARRERARILSEAPPIHQSDIRAAYKAKGFKNSAGKPRRLGRDELQMAQAEVSGSNVGLSGTAGLPMRSARRPQISKADPGGGMTRSQRRMRFTASGGLPVIGDATSAVQAARLAPEARRNKVAAQQYGANVGSAAAGNVAGGVGAAALATKHKGFERVANHANDWVDHKVDRARNAVGLKPAQRGPSKIAAHIEGSKMPKVVRSAARMVASKPKVAAIGALAGGAIAGNVGSQVAYSRIMTNDDRYRKANQSATHGSRVIKGGPEPKPLSQRETKQLSRRKEHNAAMSMMTGTTGLTALGATVGAKGLRSRAGRKLVHPRRALPLARTLEKAPVPALTIGAGIGGLNSFTGAAIQRKEAKRQEALLAKSYLGHGRWMPASEVNPKMLRALRGHPSAKHRSTPGEAKSRKIWPAMGPTRHLGNSASIINEWPEPKMGFTAINGLGGGKLYVAPNASRHTFAHEVAHLEPKRNPHHFTDRIAQPTRRGREEGRADFLAHGMATPGRYPGGEHFQSGYNEVQGKMAAARKRRVEKGLRLSGIRRAKGMRGGYLRQTRTSTGTIRVSAVRGGLG